MATESEEDEESLVQELQVLESIYLDELQISREDRLLLRITLHPATGHDSETQYVRFTLELSLPTQYPAEVPEISVKNPRGLGDEQIHSIISSLRSVAEQGVGSPILYELIEKGKEMLTDSNVPRGHCVICLYNFQEGDSLTKTPCFHHFHSHCLGRYAEHSQEQAHISVLSVLCPVCREKVSCDLDKLRGALPPRNPEETYEPDSATLQKREELRRIYQVQLDKGGIIDLEAEKKRFFISIQEPQPSTDPILTSQSGDVPSTRPEDVPSTRPEDVPSTRPEDVLSTRPLDVPSTQPLDVPSTRPVDIPSTRPVDIPLTRPVDAPSQFVGSSSCQPEEVPFSQPKNVRTNKSLDVPSHKPVDIQSKQNKREFFPPLPNETNPPYSRGHSERQKSGYRNHFYRLPHYDHSDNSHLHRGRGRRPHGRARPERNERSGEVKPDISRGHGNPSRGNFKGRNFRTGGIVQRSSRGTEENVMTDNPS